MYATMARRVERRTARTLANHFCTGGVSDVRAAPQAFAERSQSQVDRAAGERSSGCRRNRYGAAASSESPPVRATDMRRSHGVVARRGNHPIERSQAARVGRFVRESPGEPISRAGLRLCTRWTAR